VMRALTRVSHYPDVVSAVCTLGLANCGGNVGYFIRVEVLRALSMKSNILWDMTPCSSLEVR
jgi:hypothetical protein